MSDEISKALDNLVDPKEVALSRVQSELEALKKELQKTAAAPTVAPAHSPTGDTALPQWVIKAGLALAVISGAIIAGPETGLVVAPAVLAAAKFVNLGLLLLGISSQGLRKQVQEKVALEAGANAQASDAAALKELNK